MIITSTNIAQPITVIKNGKKVKTGIYKKSVNHPIRLGKTDVVGDAVMDREHHGGIDKACYLYSLDHYTFWREQFPKLEWENGMFGENLTVEGLDESKIMIGDTFEVGAAIVQVSEPRRPCSILGIRFGTQHMVKMFNNSDYPGVYVRILKEGDVKIGDKFKLIQKCDTLSIKNVFNLFSSNCIDKELANKAINIPSLANDCKKSIKKKFNL